MHRQQATLTVNLCEPIHITINRTSAAGDSYNSHTNSNWKCEYVTNSKIDSHNYCMSRTAAKVKQVNMQPTAYTIIDFLITKRID